MLPLQAFFEVWAEGETWEEVEASFRRCDPALVAPYTGPQTSFKVQLEPFGCRIPAAEYRPMIDRLAFVPMQVGAAGRTRQGSRGGAQPWRAAQPRRSPGAVRRGEGH